MTVKEPRSDGVLITKTLRIITEPGFYMVVTRSNKPEAKTFAKWVCEEVIPTIRKTGGYAVGPETPALFEELDSRFSRLEETFEEQFRDLVNVIHSSAHPENAVVVATTKKTKKVEKKVKEKSDPWTEAEELLAEMHDCQLHGLIGDISVAVHHTVLARFKMLAGYDPRDKALKKITSRWNGIPKWKCIAYMSREHPDQFEHGLDTYLKAQVDCIAWSGVNPMAVQLWTELREFYEDLAEAMASIDIKTLSDSEVDGMPWASLFMTRLDEAERMPLVERFTKLQEKLVSENYLRTSADVLRFILVFESNHLHCIDLSDTDKEKA